MESFYLRVFIFAIVVHLTRSFDSRPENVIFTPAGTYAAATHYMHVRLPIDCNAVIEDIKHFKDVVESQAKSNSTFYFSKDVERLTKRSMVFINQTENSFTAMLGSLPQKQAKAGRAITKRQFGLIAGIAGLAFGIFNSFRIEAIDARLSKVRKFKKFPSVCSGMLDVFLNHRTVTNIVSIPDRKASQFIIFEIFSIILF